MCPELAQAVEAAVAEEGWKMVLLLRLSPVVPFALLNYMLSLTPHLLLRLRLDIRRRHHPRHAALPPIPCASCSTRSRIAPFLSCWPKEWPSLHTQTWSFCAGMFNVGICTA